MRPTTMIAAPYYDKDPSVIQENITIARTCAIWLWENGFYVLTPHLNTANFHCLTNVEEQVYRDFYLKVIRSGLTDLLVMTGEWHERPNSFCHQELKLATCLGIPAYVWDYRAQTKQLERINA